MSDSYLLALDFRGTLDALYSWSAAEQEKLKALLSYFHDHQWKIVFASNEEEENLRHFCVEYQIFEYITAYKSNKNLSKLSPMFADNKMDILLEEDHTLYFNDKTHQLKEYAEQFALQKDHIYFFDDVGAFIDLAKAAGFVNAKKVSRTKNLLACLMELLKKWEVNCDELFKQENFNPSIEKKSEKKFLWFIKNSIARPMVN